jgi:phosphatidate phosphatase PAH1
MLIVHHHHHCKAKHSTTVKQECAQVIADRRYVIAKEIVDNWLRKAWISLLPSNLCQALESSLFSKQEQETATRTRNENKNKSNKNTKQEQEQDTATRTRNKNTKQEQEQETIQLSHLYQSVDGSSLFSKQDQEQDGELSSEQREHEKRSMELLQVV